MPTSSPASAGAPSGSATSPAVEGASGLPDGLLRLHLREAVAIERDEVDRIDHQGREDAVPGGVRDDLPREGEHQARAFDHHHGMHGVLRNADEAQHRYPIVVRRDFDMREAPQERPVEAVDALDRN